MGPIKKILILLILLILSKLNLLILSKFFHRVLFLTG